MQKEQYLHKGTKPNPPVPWPKGEGAVLKFFDKLINYNIILPSTTNKLIN